MKAILSIIISAALVVSGLAQTRNVLVGTNSAVVQPTNFWSADASNARTGLGLRSAATNPASAFQPASATLSNLVSGGAVTFSNITIGLTNVSGLQASLDGKLGTNPTLSIANISGLQTNLDLKLSLTGNAVNLTNFPAYLLRVDGDGASLTNIQVANVVGALATNGNGSGLTNLTAANITGTVALASNVTGTIAISNGGSGATTAGGARTNLGLGWTALTNTNAATSLLGFSSNGEVVANTGTNVLTFTNDVKFGGGEIIINASSIFWSGNGIGINFEEGAFISGDTNSQWRFEMPFYFTSSTFEATTRANLGFSTNLNTLWTATNASNARSAVGLSWSALTNSNPATSLLGYSTNGQVVYAGTNTLTFTNSVNVASFSIRQGTSTYFYAGDDVVESYVNFSVYEAISFSGSNSAAATRINLGFSDNLNTLWTATNSADARSVVGLGWSALTNTNMGTSLVSVDTNGSVVSPTNFWQNAPIGTAVYTFAPITNASTNITGARNIYVYSLATNITGVTATINLPTNGTTFNGDTATVVHRGTTSSVTTVKQSTNTIISISNYDTAVKFINESGTWKPYHNISFVESIKFAGTNDTLNIAQTRTNLNLGAIWLTNTNVTNFNTSIGLGVTNNVEFNQLRIGGSSQMSIQGAAGNISFYDGIDSEIVLQIPADTDPVIINSQWNDINVRSNLGLPLAALTNTNAAGFQQAIFTTNSPPTNAGNFGDHAAWIGISIVTNGVTNIFNIPVYK